MCVDDGLCHPVSAKFVEVVESGFRAWEYDDVRLFNVFRVVGVEEVYARVAFENVEVGEVADMVQENDGDVYLVFRK